MTKIRKETYCCPKCKQYGEFKMYETINVDLDHTLKEKVISGELFTWTCPHCNEKMLVLYDFLYHDMTREFMIYFSPSKSSEYKDSINDMLDKFPGMRGRTYRIVDDYNQLKEKIRIFESELDDIVIELSKVLMKYQKDNKIPENGTLIFDKCIAGNSSEKNGMLVFRIIKDGKLQKEMALLSMDGYNDYKKGVQEDDRFLMDSYCENINEEWILNKLTTDN